MTIQIAAGSTLGLKAIYVDAKGNPTSPPPGAGQITWSDTDAAIATLDSAIGGSVTATAIGAVDATLNLTVTDGSMTSQPTPVVIVAGPAVGLVIQPA